ncbi:hypothetical protein FOA52_016259 [Chlamydomonas sp. UWO 241]|nr:hypothetical protein FOA52_016259 [Chlamydomonas sp. UWO 241]
MRYSTHEFSAEDELLRGRTSPVYRPRAARSKGPPQAAGRKGVNAWSLVFGCLCGPSEAEERHAPSKSIQASQPAVTDQEEWVRWTQHNPMFAAHKAGATPSDIAATPIEVSLGGGVPMADAAEARSGAKPKSAERGLISAAIYIIDASMVGPDGRPALGNDSTGAKGEQQQQAEQQQRTGRPLVRSRTPQRQWATPPPSPSADHATHKDDDGGGLSLLSRSQNWGAELRSPSPPAGATHHRRPFMTVLAKEELSTLSERCSRSGKTATPPRDRPAAPPTTPAGGTADSLAVMAAVWSSGLRPLSPQPHGRPDFSSMLPRKELSELSERCCRSGKTATPPRRAAAGASPRADEPTEPFAGSLVCRSRDWSNGLRSPSPGLRGRAPFVSCLPRLDLSEHATDTPAATPAVRHNRPGRSASRPFPAPSPAATAAAAAAKLDVWVAASGACDDTFNPPALLFGVSGAAKPASGRSPTPSPQPRSAPPTAPTTASNTPRARLVRQRAAEEAAGTTLAQAGTRWSQGLRSPSPSPRGATHKQSFRAVQAAHAHAHALAQQQQQPAPPPPPSKSPRSQPPPASAGPAISASIRRGWIRPSTAAAMPAAEAVASHPLDLGDFMHDNLSPRC